MATCDPQALLNSANCFDCLTNQQLEQVQVQMLCDILNTGLAGGPFIPVSDGPFVHIAGDTMTGQLNVQSFVRGLDAAGLESWTIRNNAQANQNLFFGQGAGTASAGAANCVGLGSFAMAAVNNGGDNVGVGSYALFKLTDGNYNVGLGKRALQENLIGSGNMALDAFACRNTTGDYNVAIGYQALNLNTSGSYNVAVGSTALRANLIGSQNIAFGDGSLVVSTGDQNVAIGVFSGLNLTTGENNVFVGHACGGGVTTGDDNTIIGSGVVGLAGGTSNNVILADGAGVIRWHTIATGLTGLGTSAPKSKLDIVGNLTVGATYGGANAAPTSGAIIEGQVGIGTNAPNANALLDLVSTTLGFKLPTMTTAQKNAIANTAGLMVFDTDLGKACVNSGAGWQTITSV